MQSDNIKPRWQQQTLYVKPDPTINDTQQAVARHKEADK